MADPVQAVIGVGLIVAGAAINFIPNPIASAMIFAGIGFVRAGIFGFAEAQEGVMTNVASTTAAIPIIYGQGVKVGMAVVDTRVDPNSDDRKDLYLVGAICCGGSETADGGIEGITRVWFNEREAISSSLDLNTAGMVSTNNHPDFAATFLKYQVRTGTQTQSHSTVLNGVDANAWPTTSDGRSVAYIVFQLTWDKNIGVYQNVPNVTMLVDGPKVFDPRTSTWVVSSNPALHLYDYLTNSGYGCAVPASEIDSQSFQDAADTCEEEPYQVGLDRFVSNGWLSSGDSHETNIQKLLSAMRGVLVYQNGKYRLIIREVTAPVSFELTPENIIGEWTWDRGGIDQSPNIAKARYVNTNFNNQVLEAIWPHPGDTTFLDTDQGFPSEVVMDLPMTDNYLVAHQIAMVTLKEMRQDLSCTLKATDAATVLEIGDVVRVTHPTPGWTQNQFWVAGVAHLTDGTVNLALREYDSAAYSLDTIDAEPTLPNTDLPDPFSVPAPATGPFATSTGAEGFLLPAGEFHPRILVNWTLPEYPFIDYTEVFYRKEADADWITAGRVDVDADQEFYIDEVDVGVSYRVAVQLVNTINVRSALTQSASAVTVGGGDQTRPDAGEWIINGDFENGASFWWSDDTAVIDQASPISGSNSLKVTAGSGESEVYQVVTATDDITIGSLALRRTHRVEQGDYTFTVGQATVAVDCELRMSKYNMEASFIEDETLLVWEAGETSRWTQKKYTIEEGVRYVQLYIWVDSGSGDCYFDGLNGILQHADQQSGPDTSGTSAGGEREKLRRGGIDYPYISVKGGIKDESGTLETINPDGTVGDDLAYPDTLENLKDKEPAEKGVQQNLLSWDSTSLVTSTTNGPDYGAGDIPLSQLGLVAGTSYVVWGGEVASETGTDELSFNLLFKDSGGSSVGNPNAGLATSDHPTFTRLDSDPYLVPANAVTVKMTPVYGGSPIFENHYWQNAYLCRGTVPPAALPVFPPLRPRREPMPTTASKGSQTDSHPMGSKFDRQRTSDGETLNWSGSFTNQPALTLGSLRIMTYDPAANTDKQYLEIDLGALGLTGGAVSARLYSGEDTTVARGEGWSITKGGVEGSADIDQEDEIWFSKIDHTSATPTNYTVNYRVFRADIPVGVTITVILEHENGVSWDIVGSKQYTFGSTFDDTIVASVATNGTGFDEFRIRWQADGDPGTEFQISLNNAAGTTGGGPTGKPGIEYLEVTLGASDQNATPNDSDYIDVIGVEV